ncbi:MAG TPA: GDSL-type esterase/lipase family protein [Jatrophihabitans sp.]|nr:GDSL-type esterase/lipase family protein [Jatrophihabitans sp.]
MKPSSVRRLAVLAASAAAVGATLVATLPNASAAPAAHHPARTSTATKHAEPRYLALGDSVPFGYRGKYAVVAPNYNKPHSFVGYPEIVARDLGFRLINASCPGETTASMINKTRKSNGCTNVNGSGPGYRDAYPLKVKYSDSQLRFALSFLRQHPKTKLVSLMIGANDGFLCQEFHHGCQGSAQIALIKRIQKNVTTIMDRIRNRAHYKGQVVIVNYYSLNYADANQNALVSILNQVVDNAAKPYHVQVADGFGALQKAAKIAGGNTCAAGLLWPTPADPTPNHPCDVHPSPAGQALLATAVEPVVRKG